MRGDSASLWYRRMAMVYAIGAWSLLGSMFLLTRKEKESGDEVERQEDGPANEETVTTSELQEPLRGFYVETIVTYKKDFVPLTEKIHNFLKSWTGGSGPES